MRQRVPYSPGRRVDFAQLRSVAAHVRGLRQIKRQKPAFWHFSVMFCCLIAAALLGPLGLWVRARPVGPDCCVDNRRTIRLAALAALAVAGLCLAMFLLASFQPAPFRHICSVFQRI
jgi:hypothetical protein